MKRLSPLLLGLSTVGLISLSGCGLVGRIFMSKPVKIAGDILIGIAIECALNGCLNNQEAAVELKESPELYVEAYFKAINEGHYEDGWYSLSAQFQTNMAAKGGYDSYLEWWQDTVKSVEINSIEVVSQTDKEAVIDTNLTYYKYNGRNPSEDVTFILIWEENSKRWLFDRSQK